MLTNSSITRGSHTTKNRYSKVPDSNYCYIDLQFKKTPPKVPYKGITIAAVLFLFGSLLIIIGMLLLTGNIKVTNPERAVLVLITGILMLISGFYILRIAYYASRGYRGYSYEAIL